MSKKQNQHLVVQCMPVVRPASTGLPDASAMSGTGRSRSTGGDVAMCKPAHVIPKLPFSRETK